MPRLVIPSYTVVRDTREKKGHGWYFNAHNIKHSSPCCNGTVVETLKTGDYSLLGYTDILAIERKADFSELWGNYLAKNKKIFELEMERMSCLKYAYIIIESLLTPDIMQLSPPQFTKGVPGKSLIKWLLSLSIKYGVHIIPAGSCGRKVAQFIFEQVIRVEKDRWVSNNLGGNCLEY